MGWLEENINSIINDDCINVMKKIESNSIDLIVTDPPYLTNYKTSYRKDKNHRFCSVISNDNNEELIIKSIKEMHRILKNNSAMYMFCSCDKVDFFKTELQKYFNIKNMIIWVKNNWTAGDLENAYGKQYEICFYVNKGLRKINGKRITDVWNSKEIRGINRVVGNEQLHQNQKPVELIKMMIEKSSNENDLILDPFAGSGTTAEACKELNRKYICCEIDKYYYSLAVDRINGICKNGQTSIFTDFDNL